VNERRDLFGAERRVAAVDDGLEIVGRDLGPRNVEAEDLEGELGVREVFPVALPSVLAIDSRGQDESNRSHERDAGEDALMRPYPVLCGGNLMRQEETPVGGEALEDNGFERELESRSAESAAEAVRGQQTS
jgi:hypothetical protein